LRSTAAACFDLCGQRRRAVEYFCEPVVAHVIAVEEKILGAALEHRQRALELHRVMWNGLRPSCDSIADRLAADAESRVPLVDDELDELLVRQLYEVCCAQRRCAGRSAQYPRLGDVVARAVREDVRVHQYAERAAAFDRREQAAEPVYAMPGEKCRDRDHRGELDRSQCARDVRCDLIEQRAR
jgi:hypothetical protein